MPADSLHNDPFSRFERSRGGFLIPVFLFIVGALVTVWATRTLADLHEVDLLAMKRAQAIQMKEEQRAHALEELKELIRGLQHMTPEQQQEFLRNNPQIKITRKPASPTSEILQPDTQPTETNQP